MSECCNTPGGFIFAGSWSDTDFGNELEYNLKLWLDYSFLSIGAWQNVNTGEENCGADYSVVYPVESAADTGLYLYGVNRKGLVWESVTVDSGSTQPVTIYEDGVDVTTGLDIHYDLGTFSSSQEYTGQMVASYSYRTINTYVSSTANWWTQIITNQIDINEDVIWGVFKKHGITLPSIVISCTDYGKSRAIQLGTNAKYIERAVDLFVITKSKLEKNKLVSILMAQKYNTFGMFNTDTAEFPIGCGGVKINNNTYQDLVTNFGWKCVTINDVSAASIDSPCEGLHLSRVRFYLEAANPIKT